MIDLKYGEKCWLIFIRGSQWLEFLGKCGYIVELAYIAACVRIRIIIYKINIQYLNLSWNFVFSSKNGNNTPPYIRKNSFWRGWSFRLDFSGLTNTQRGIFCLLWLVSKIEWEECLFQCLIPAVMNCDDLLWRFVFGLRNLHKQTGRSIQLSSVSAPVKSQIEAVQSN